jgi:hypothetical protein
MGLSFTIAICPRQHSHSQVRVPQDSLPHFTVSDSRPLQPGGPGPRIYIPQEQSGPVIPPRTGFPFRGLLRLAGLRWRYSTPPPHAISAAMDLVSEIKVCISAGIETWSSSPLVVITLTELSDCNYQQQNPSRHVLVQRLHPSYEAALQSLDDCVRVFFLLNASGPSNSKPKVRYVQLTSAKPSRQRGCYIRTMTAEVQLQYIYIYIYMFVNLKELGAKTN